MPESKRFPIYGWPGIILLASAWILNWSLTGLRTQFLFFPLWLGYCLMVDALVYFRKGTSLLTHSRKKYLELFAMAHLIVGILGQKKSTYIQLVR
jgi:hypothetical protein